MRVHMVAPLTLCPFFYLYTIYMTGILNILQVYPWIFLFFEKLIGLQTSPSCFLKSF